MNSKVEKWTVLEGRSVVGCRSIYPPHSCMHFTTVLPSLLLNRLRLLWELTSVSEGLRLCVRSMFVKLASYPFSIQSGPKSKHYL